MPRPAIPDHNLFFFDCETGGLKVGVNEILEVSCIVTDPSALRVLKKYTAKVRPVHPDRVDPKAAAINGYTPQVWEKEAIPLDDAMVSMLSMARDSIFVAHNAPFDWGFFEHAMSVRGQRWPGDYHRVDTCALAWPLLRAGKVPSVKLQTLVDYFGIVNEAAHRASGDVEACRQLYVKLMEMFMPAVDPSAAVVKFDAASTSPVKTTAPFDCHKEWLPLIKQFKNPVICLTREDEFRLLEWASPLIMGGTLYGQVLQEGVRCMPKFHGAWIQWDAEKFEVREATNLGAGI